MDKVLRWCVFVLVLVNGSKVLHILMVTENQEKCEYIAGLTTKEEVTAKTGNEALEVGCAVLSSGDLFTFK